MLPPQCTYYAVDQSPVQVKLAQQRLSKFGEYHEHLKSTEALIPVSLKVYLSVALMYLAMHTHKLQT